MGHRKVHAPEKTCSPSTKTTTMTGNKSSSCSLTSWGWLMSNVSSYVSLSSTGPLRSKRNVQQYNPGSHSVGTFIFPLRLYGPAVVFIYPNLISLFRIRYVPVFLVINYQIIFYHCCQNTMKSKTLTRHYFLVRSRLIYSFTALLKFSL